MKWWDQMPSSSLSECWFLSQLFHSLLSVSSRSSLVPLAFYHKGGVICISEVVDISPGRLDSSCASSIPTFHKGFPCGSAGRVRLQCRRPGFDPWVGKIPWRRERLPTAVFWPREFHGLYSPRGRKESDTTDTQPWRTPFSIWSQSVVPYLVLTVASWSA